MKILSIVAARPNFMKVAPIIRAINRHNACVDELSATSCQPSAISHIHHILVHTGQHYDYEMSQVFFQDLKLPEPDYHLGVGSGTHAEQTGRTMIEVEKVLVAEQPDMVLVVGDVNATVAAALAAVKLHIPVAHVEAGIRSGDMSMPEEVNRRLTDHISDYLFTTSKCDDENLRREGIPEGKIFRVGNVMADSLLYCRELAEKSDIVGWLGLKKGGYVLATLHRPSNVDDKESLSRIIGALMDISEKIPVVFPAHPRTRKNLDDFGLLPQSQLSAISCQPSAISYQLPVTKELSAVGCRLLVTSPLGYLSFLNLEMNAKMVITDSGGVQVETTVFGIPCLTLLDTPLWTVTHEEGTNILVGSNRQKLIEEVLNILEGKGKGGGNIPFWDGKAAERIVQVLLNQDRGGLTPPQ